MKLFIQILTVLICTSSEVFACDCPPTDSFKRREESYNRVDLVFLGEYVGQNIKNNSQLFKVIEPFKGEIYKDTIEVTGKSNCSMSNFSEGIWLIYGDYNNDSTIAVSICNATRSFEEIKIPPLLPLFPDKKISYQDSLSFEVNKTQRNLKELSYLIADIELYRSRKKNKHPSENQNPSTYWFFSISIIFNLLLLILLLKKKNASR
jgi:hypothetical protein